MESVPQEATEGSGECPENSAEVHQRPSSPPTRFSSSPSGRRSTVKVKDIDKMDNLKGGKSSKRKRIEKKEETRCPVRIDFCQEIELSVPLKAKKKDMNRKWKLKISFDSSKDHEEANGGDEKDTEVQLLDSASAAFISLPFRSIVGRIQHYTLYNSIRLFCQLCSF